MAKKLVRKTLEMIRKLASEEVEDEEVSLSDWWRHNISLSDWCNGAYNSNISGIEQTVTKLVPLFRPT